MSLIAPETEARLREEAERRGQNINQLIDSLLANDPDVLTPSQINSVRAGIRRGLQAAAEGRERPLSEYAADVQKRREAR